MALPIDTVENGAEAVKRIAASKSGDYELVLMDIQNPVMDATRQRSRSAHWKIPHWLEFPFWP